MNIKIGVNAVTRVVDTKVPMEQVYKLVQTAAAGARIQLCPFTAGAGYLQWSPDGDGWVRFRDLDDTEKGIVAQDFTVRRQHMIDALKGAPLAGDILTVPSDEFLLVRHNGADYDIALAAWGYRYPDRAAGLELNSWKSNTKYQEVNIEFMWDGKPIPNMPFTLEGFAHFTDMEGIFHVDRPLPVGMRYRLHTSGNPVPSAEDHSFTLTVEQNKDRYSFDLTQLFDIEVVVTEDGFPLSGAECDVEFGGRHERLVTDVSGRAMLRLPLVRDIVGHIEPVQPQCVTTCRGRVLDYIPRFADESHTFEFDFEGEKVVVPEPPVVAEEVPEPEKPVVPDPETVTITILDYEGYPVADMPLKLKAGAKGVLDLRTDDKGTVTVPADMLTDRKKVNISFTVTPEYQESHDIHYYKKK